MCIHALNNLVFKQVTSKKHQDKIIVNNKDKGIFTIFYSDIHQNNRVMPKN